MSASVRSDEEFRARETCPRIAISAVTDGIAAQPCIIIPESGRQVRCEGELQKCSTPAWGNLPLTPCSRAYPHLQRPWVVSLQLARTKLVGRTSVSLFTVLFDGMPCAERRGCETVICCASECRYVMNHYGTVVVPFTAMRILSTRSRKLPVVFRVCQMHSGVLCIHHNQSTHPCCSSCTAFRLTYAYP